jgi:hypothetical protein
MPKSLIFAAMVFACATALAAGATCTSARAGDRSAPARLQQLLGDIDPRDVPTGILYDRVVPLSQIDRYTGAESSPPMGIREWRQICFEMANASTARPEWPSLGDIERIGSRIMARGAVPLVFLNFRYDRIRPDALKDGSVSIQSGRLVRTGAEAFVSRTAYAASALKDYTYRGQRVVFALDRRLYASNDGAGPVRIEVDFDDGKGFRRVDFGSDLTVSYERPGKKTIRTRTEMSDGRVLHGSFVFRVEALLTPNPNDTLSVTASIPFNGGYGTGEAYVYLSGAHTAITNPIVVVEGFDLDNTMNWDELYELLNQQNLLETLRADGFDSVVLNFTDATDYVQKNSLVVVELLEQIEAMLDPYRDIALVGGSMGGLCGRYALSYMEHNGLGHRVRTFISFDGPQKGANIPLGIQYWLDFFSGLSTDASYLLSRLDTPAARQMLLYHHTTPPGTAGESDPLRAAMLSDFATVGGYPALPRKIAIANGSGNRAGQGFSPGSQIIDYEYSGLFISITGNVWAVPDAGSHLIFDGLIRIIVPTDQLSVNVSGTLPYDNAPGGRRDSMAQMDSTRAPYGDIIALYPSHCFVPTVSALDLDTGDPFYDIAGDPDLLSHTPFDAVYFPADNQDHMTITAETASWIIAELESSVTGVTASSPLRLELSPPFPNPVSLGAVVQYSTDRQGPVEIAVYDVAGRRIAGVLESGGLAPGPGTARVDTRSLPSGVYFIRLNAAGASIARKLVVLH